MLKAGFTAIIGRPSSGKSTLLNALCKKKISITSPVPQTTRNKIRGIYTEARGQIVFVDTPGYHLSERKMNLYMKEAAESSLDDIDLVLYILDPTRPPGEEETAIAEFLKQECSRGSRTLDKSLLIVINKMDLITEKQKSAIRDLKLFLEDYLPEAEIFHISAEKQSGLKELITGILERMPEGEMFYPEEFYTDQEPAFRMAEVIREKAILRSREEVPHSLYVEIADVEEKKGDQLWIRAFLTVERDSQKGILVGKGGSTIKEIRTAAQKELKKVFERPVYLDLRVKVNKKWRKKDPLLRNLIG